MSVAHFRSQLGNVFRVKADPQEHCAHC